MSLNRLFETIEKARESASWEAAFGQPQEIEGKTIIPVAQVGYGFGLGFGSGQAPAESGDEAEAMPSGEGGGGGGGNSSKPLGMVVVTDEDVYFEPVQDEGKIALAAMAVGALVVWQLAKTLRALIGR